MSRQRYLACVINQRLATSHYLVLFFFMGKIALLVANAINMHDIFYSLSLKSLQETRGACVCPLRQPAR